ncbi:MAG: ribose-phosphate pyrophosphokinase [Candidatus Kentron sp. G]|nr:MAG: ribose-phosphate pyrophosphokinase [Candidatus Kentron sp. G]VFN06443.1 MAG: ribose-phosphate pyrophosphokinase [Candidatus Kentron sp. G]VFN06879.1 MAG: ribose-phosphate pyrophosphokinase [Candidatus Kentron sp. G]
MLLAPKLFCGSSIPGLASKVASSLSVEVSNADVKRFPDGEVDVRINESVRSHDVFLLQSICYPANDHLMELLLMIDACRRASAGRINAVIPYLGYGRQDRVMYPRTPISAKVVANTLISVGVDRVVTIDFHAGQLQGFFDVPVDHLHGAPLLIQRLRELNLTELVVVAPDAGGVERAGRFAMGLGGSMALIDQRGDKAKSMQLIGDVRGMDCLIVDDMIDTGGTLFEATDLLITGGARSVRAAVTHPVLSGSAAERVNRSKLTEIICTDTIPLPVEKQIDRITVVSVAERLATVIRNVHTGESVTRLSY